MLLHGVQLSENLLSPFTGYLLLHTLTPQQTYRVHDLKLERFIRTKKEINRDAILTDLTAIRNIVGISIRDCFKDYAIESTDIRYTVGRGQGKEASEILIFNWDTQKDPPDLF